MSVNYWNRIKLRVLSGADCYEGIHQETIRIYPQNSSFVGAPWMPYSPIWKGGDFEAAQPLLVVDELNKTRMRIRQGEAFSVVASVVN